MFPFPFAGSSSVIEAIKHGAEVLYGALLPILKHYAAVDLASNNAFDLNMTDWIAYLRATDCFDDDENSPERAHEGDSFRERISTYGTRLYVREARRIQSVGRRFRATEVR